MRKLLLIISALLITISSSAQQNARKSSARRQARTTASAKADKSPIVLATPIRPANQKDVINLTVPKMDVVRVGFVGLGMRGPGAVERWANIDGTDIKALCDLDADRVEKSQKILERNGRHRADAYSGSADA